MIWSEVAAVLERSEALVYIGYSPPEYDSYSRHAFQRFASGRHIEVYNPFASWSLDRLIWDYMTSIMLTGRSSRDAGEKVAGRHPATSRHRSAYWEQCEVCLCPRFARFGAGTDRCVRARSPVQRNKALALRGLFNQVSAQRSEIGGYHRGWNRVEDRAPRLSCLIIPPAYQQ
jgi:hypothetical protein